MKLRGFSTELLIRREPNQVQESDMIAEFENPRTRLLDLYQAVHGSDETAKRVGSLLKTFKENEDQHILAAQFAGSLRAQEVQHLTLTSQLLSAGEAARCLQESIVANTQMFDSNIKHIDNKIKIF
eukprot:GHVR01048119.1.p1 GENE.GHVR01048119.1~~GHVR01048119.1.p1  ORF type:complete len:126 (-),score=20.96 GHVR01048119.1:85-462(-)